MLPVLTPHQERRLADLKADAGLLGNRDEEFDHDVLRAYAQDANGGQLHVLLFQRDLPIDVLRFVAESPLVKTLTFNFLAQRTSLPEEIQMIVYQREPQVQDTLSKNRSLAPAVQRLMLEGNVYLHWVLAENRNLAPDVQESLYAGGSGVVRDKLARNPVLIPRLQHVLFNNHWTVHHALVSNPSLVVEIQDKFAEIPEHRLALAGNPGLAPHLQVLYSHGDVLFQNVLAKNRGVVPSGELAVSFLVEHHWDWIMQEADPAHWETVRALAVNWGKSFPELLEACTYV